MSFTYKDPEKPQQFKECWSKKQAAGLCYIQDIRHAISNSDQFPFPLWETDYQHMAAQQAQEETLRAVIAAIDRVPIYKDELSPDAISRQALTDYLIANIEKYGEDYGVDDILRDIREFQIRRECV